MTRKKKRRALSPQRALRKGIRITKRLITWKGPAPGTAPGTLVYKGPQKVDQVTFDVFRYDETAFHEAHPDNLENCFPMGPERVTWINIDGLHDTEALRRLGELASLHPLVLEDIADTGQRPKLEDYDHQLYIVLRMLRYGNEGTIDEEQLSIILGPDSVLTVQETPGDVLDPVRDRLRAGKGRARRLGNDYLAYAIMDTVVDAYFTVVERLSDRIAALEEEILDDADSTILADLHRIRGDLLLMKRAVWPLRDLFNTMIRDESRLIGKETKIFLRDAHDHAVQVIDTLEALRDVLNGLADLYLSTVSNRMNEVMKVLTVIATIFIPLTFLVGVYGMNFDFMPELGIPWAYPALWGVMVLVAVLMISYFRYKRWF
ncbi:MAG: magnesium/cobalt transporter CorA [Gemmatimonadetes bacterium]|nr:magnesium/cobalt transporter CorA [Gemmatimonadota bacterium]